MSLPDDAAIASLAARLRLSPRELLALAGRIASAPGAAPDPCQLATEIARVRGAQDATPAAAGLLLLGYGSFAQDDIDTALALAWPGATAPAG
jgi:hypothetical protein